MMCLMRIFNTNKCLLFVTTIHNFITLFYTTSATNQLTIHYVWYYVCDQKKINTYLCCEFFDQIRFYFVFLK